MRALSEARICVDANLDDTYTVWHEWVNNIIVTRKWYGVIINPNATRAYISFTERLKVTTTKPAPVSSKPPLATVQGLPDRKP